MSARASFVLLQKRSGDAAHVAPRRSKRPAAKYDSSGHIIAKLLSRNSQPTTTSLRCAATTRTSMFCFRLD